MLEEFVSLRNLFSSAPAEPVPEPAEDAAPPPALLEADDLCELLSEIRCFRARLTDAFDTSYERLLRDLASAVLARELALAPADLAAIARRALDRAMEEEPVQLRAHPTDIETLRPLRIGIQADSSLRPGDCVIDLIDGEIDASLGVRVEAVLRAVSS